MCVFVCISVGLKWQNKCFVTLCTIQLHLVCLGGRKIVTHSESPVCLTEVCWDSFYIMHNTGVRLYTHDTKEMLIPSKLLMDPLDFSNCYRSLNRANVHFVCMMSLLGCLALGESCGIRASMSFVVFVLVTCVI